MHLCRILLCLLADRTNGRAIATVSVVVCLSSSSVTLCIVAKWCILEQKLLLTSRDLERSNSWPQ